MRSEKSAKDDLAFVYLSFCICVFTLVYLCLFICTCGSGFVYVRTYVFCPRQFSAQMGETMRCEVRWGNVQKMTLASLENIWAA